MNLLKEMFYAIKSPAVYPEFLKNKKLKIFFYGVLLLSLYFILSVMVPFISFQITKGGVSGIVDQYVPEFVYEDGVLWLEEPVELDDGNNFIYLDTSPEFYLENVGDYKTRFSGYQNVIVTDGYEVLVKSEGQWIILDLEEAFGYDRYDNESLNSLLPMVNMFIFAGITVLYVIELAFFFFGILFLSLIGLIVNSVAKAGLSFGQIFIFSIYTRTLSLAIKALVGFLPFGIPFFGVINFGISVIYLYLACQSMKKDVMPVEVNIIQ